MEDSTTPFDRAAGDPLAAAYDEGNGVPELRQARTALAGRSWDGALDLVSRARARGIPAEVMPHAHLVEAIALVGAGRSDAAQALLADAWRDYPDVAAIPAALGAAQADAGSFQAATRSLFAALVSDDPDDSVRHWQWALTRLMRHTHQAE